MANDVIIINELAVKVNGIAAAVSDSGPTEEVKKSPLKRIFGISLILCSSFIFSGSATAAKFLKNIPPGEFVIARGAYALAILLPFSLHSGVSLISFPRPGLVALRCIPHGIAYCLKIWSVKNMRIGDATAIYFTGIIFAGIYSRIFLKEKYTLVNAVSTVFGIVGVVLIAKPSFLFPDSGATEAYPSVYCLITLSAACLCGIGYTSQRALGKGMHPSITTFYMNVTVVMGGILLNLFTGAEYELPSCYADRLILSACGVGACVGLVMLNRGLSIEKSAPATLIRNMDIVLAFIVQVFLFKEEVDWESVLGAVLILASTVCVTLERALCPNYFWQL